MNVLLIDNYDSFTYNLAQYLGELGADVHVERNDALTLESIAAKAPEAAEALGLTAHRLKALGLIDKIVNEPLGGAHRDPKGMAALLRRALSDSLRQFQGMSIADLKERRFERLMAYGKFKETTPGA